LVQRDEAGYSHYTVLVPDRPVCTMTGADAFAPAESGLSEIHSFSVGEGASRAAVRDRLSRLLGQRVTVRGELMHTTTGYQKTKVVLDVQQVEPLTAAGRRALEAPKVEARLKDVEVYNVVINAGTRLVIEARDQATGSLLSPPELYVSNWMTGGYVVYLNCPDSYERHGQSIMPPDGAMDLPYGYGFNFKPEPPVVLKFRCTKKH
jgi:hypothetical protein